MSDSLDTRIFLTVPETAIACGVSVSTVRRMLASGVLTPVRHFGDTRIAVEEIRSLSKNIRHNREEAAN